MGFRLVVRSVDEDGRLVLSPSDDDVIRTAGEEVEIYVDEDADLDVQEMIERKFKNCSSVVFVEKSEPKKKSGFFSIPHAMLGVGLFVVGGVAAAIVKFALQGGNRKGQEQKK